MKINAIYPTFQGEGKYMGEPVVLVRIAGCNGHCPWCDTKYAIEPYFDCETSLSNVVGYGSTLYKGWAEASPLQVLDA